MKISKQTKKPVKSSDVITRGAIAPDTQVATPLANIAEVSSPYDQAKSFIQNAISSLTSVAAADPIAKDSIANLAVVLFDLQGASF